jgi:hypothetical protein
MGEVGGGVKGAPLKDYAGAPQGITRPQEQSFID